MTTEQIEDKIGTLADLIYSVHEGNVRKICIDYAYLLVKGDYDRLDEFIEEFENIQSE